MLLAEHWPQAPELWQAGVEPPHSPSPAQARQVCEAALQTGVVPPHCALDVQGTQVPVVVKQAGVAPLHRLVLVAEHWPQEPDGWQAGVEPPQSVSAPHARQVCVVVLQIGVVLPHWAFDTHGTQVPPAV